VVVNVSFERLTYPDIDLLVESDACFYIEEFGSTVGHRALLRRDILFIRRSLTHINRGYVFTD
jgi:hypothetical protein